MFFRRRAADEGGEPDHPDPSRPSKEEAVAAAAALLQMAPSHETDSDTESLLEGGSAAGGVAVASKKDAAGRPVTAAAAARRYCSPALFVLVLLAVQNCGKNLLLRSVMRDQPKFLTSAAVLGSEAIKLTLSVLYILVVMRRSFASIPRFLRADARNTLLLAVPAAAYNLQMSLEYVALANLDAALFSVLVQSKLLFTATFAAAVLRTRLRRIQVVSLLLLTCGVMLCNLDRWTTSAAAAAAAASGAAPEPGHAARGAAATLGIAVSSGFASVYTERVIKGGAGAAVKPLDAEGREYGLAYTQVQLALMSLLTIGLWAIVTDFRTIVEYGLFHNFSFGSVCSIVMSALGGLIVASVLKYADSVLKGYATAMSVVLTGLLSMVLFGTALGPVYFLGIVNVVTAVLLYNGKDLDAYVCT